LEIVGKMRRLEICDIIGRRILIWMLGNMMAECGMNLCGSG
jgi:hypothetical protein